MGGLGAGGGEEELTGGGGDLRPGKGFPARIRGCGGGGSMKMMLLG